MTHQGIAADTTLVVCPMRYNIMLSLQLVCKSARDALQWYISHRLYQEQQIVFFLLTSDLPLQLPQQQKQQGQQRLLEASSCFHRLRRGLFFFWSTCCGVKLHVAIYLDFRRNLQAHGITFVEEVWDKELQRFSFDESDMVVLKILVHPSAELVYCRANLRFRGTCQGSETEFHMVNATIPLPGVNRQTDQGTGYTKTSWCHSSSATGSNSHSKQGPHCQCLNQGPHLQSSTSSSGDKKDIPVHMVDDAADAEFFACSLHQDNVAWPPPLFNRKASQLGSQEAKLREGGGNGDDKIDAEDNNGGGEDGGSNGDNNSTIACHDKAQIHLPLPRAFRGKPEGLEDEGKECAVFEEHPCLHNTYLHTWVQPIFYRATHNSIQGMLESHKLALEATAATGKLPEQLQNELHPVIAEMMKHWQHKGDEPNKAGVQLEGPQAWLNCIGTVNRLWRAFPECIGSRDVLRAYPHTCIKAYLVVKRTESSNGKGP
ncbi:hypothetical protein BDV93DRAFT_508748 [Ceratobasidium sp. AG-I]|nr:hypothetical protein BDV93DRAFT_508748 [Ceratobasidium sp. AG-I]